MSETKEESNSTSTEIKQEEGSSKGEEKTLDESSKDSEKDSVKDDSLKEESGKEGSEKDESDEDDDDDDDEEMGLLDRPVEVTGCRARKQVERLEYSFNTPKEKQEIQEGIGQKLGDCPRIEHQIQKTSIEDLKPLHRILFGRVGSAPQIKRNIRKFSGFPFEKKSTEFDRKKATVEKLTNSVLKRVCELLDLERSGTKEEIVARILEFLLEPKDSGKSVKTKKKASSKDKKKGSEKKGKNNKKPKSKKEVASDENDSANESESDETSDKGEKMEEENDEDEDEESDYDSKKKSKNASKAKKAPAKTPKKKTEKREKVKKDKKGSSKGTKRKRDDDDDTDESSDEKPNAKKAKMPSDDEIKKLVKRILESANLQEITMKKVIKQVAEAYPDCDLSHKKAFIKTTIKSVIS
ncbi:protein DEK [Trichonephila inaurata madagascariensis]|uniref:Protein DEK n=1 Tax=Trichonephila inaurata madagascariensis TaxID=2747483 RepID=A0A8X6X8A8_9ARAC|nr:protein DEK [Trichonephila inaurata madagascariensis]